jgi:hypothetical protein
MATSESLLAALYGQRAPLDKTVFTPILCRHPRPFFAASAPLREIILPVYGHSRRSRMASRRGAEAAKKTIHVHPRECASFGSSAPRNSGVKLYTSRLGGLPTFCPSSPLTLNWFLCRSQSHLSGTQPLTVLDRAVQIRWPSRSCRLMSSPGSHQLPAAV